MSEPPSSNDLLALLRFRLLDARNGSEEAKERLMGEAADEIERLRQENDDLAFRLRTYTSIAERAADETAAGITVIDEYSGATLHGPADKSSGCLRHYKAYDPTCPDCQGI